MAGRTVYLPLLELDQCSVCQKTTGLHLCSSCGEKIYCSSKCQKEDWRAHKANCGKTDRLDLGMFYPFIATLHDALSMDTGNKPLHAAMKHQIINTPDPEGPATTFPDGTSAKLIILGNPITEMDMAMDRWWPTAPTLKVMSKMQRRIMREGWLLQKCLALCMALLQEMYTTTWVPSSQSPDGEPERRVRLNYRSSPIADFGIAKGEVYVPPQDELAYYYTYEDQFSRGQDPKDHYWIYFKTVRGEEIALDCGYFTFNLCNIVSNDIYSVLGIPTTGWAPAYFIDRTMNRAAPSIHTPEKTFSILRNSKLHDAVKTDDIEAVVGFMEEVAGRKCSPAERNLCSKWTSMVGAAMDHVIQNQTWTKWPKANELQIGIEKDPNETLELTEEQSKKMNRLIKLNRQVNRGEISREKWSDSIKAWKASVGIKT